MERKIAEAVVKSFAKKGTKLSVFDAMSMTKVASDKLSVYALQKGDVTFLAWVSSHSNITFVHTKIVAW